MSQIRNHSELLAHGRSAARELALRIAERGLEACDPGRAVERSVGLDGDALRIGDRTYRLEPDGRVVVLGAGKASLAIAAALERVLGDRLDGGLVIVRDAGGTPLRAIDVVEAGHPIPDARSHAAGRALLDAASGLGERDLLLACFTGGSSALASLPPAGVPDADKQRLHSLLLGSGMPITEVNVVRKQVSAVKGGRIAAAALPARIVNLTVSDVAGDVLDALTDPTVPNETGPADAVAVLRDHALWDEVPATVRDHLLREEPGPDLGGADIQTELLVTGETACAAMREEAGAVGVPATVLGTGIEAEAGALGTVLGQIAAESARFGRPFPAPAVLLGCGGESTVRLGSEGGFGEGGPNREAALAAALRIAGEDVAAVFVDTDGADGGGAAAGAVVDGDTLARAGRGSIDLRQAITAQRSGAAVDALGDAVDTGPTHTNVNDLFVIAIGAGSA